MKQQKNKNELIKKLSKCWGYKKRAQKVEQSNFDAFLDYNGNLKITSFNWWPILENINGVYFFNNYSYSSYTSRHQSKARNIVENCKIECMDISFHDMNNKTLGNCLENYLTCLVESELSEFLSVQNKNAENRMNWSRQKYNINFENVEKLLKIIPKNKHNYFFNLYEQLFFKEMAEKLDAKLDKYWHGVDLRNKKKEIASSVDVELSF